MYFSKNQKNTHIKINFSNLCYAISLLFVLAPNCLNALLLTHICYIFLLHPNDYSNPYGISYSWLANYYGEFYSPFDIPFISITPVNYIHIIMTTTAVYILHYSIHLLFSWSMLTVTVPIHLCSRVLCDQIKNIHSN